MGDNNKEENINNEKSEEKDILELIQHLLDQVPEKKDINTVTEVKHRKIWSNINTLEEAAKKLLEIKNELGIKENRPPSRTELEKSGNIGFLNIFKIKSFTFNDVVEKAGLVPNYDPKKWSWLDGEDGLDKAAKYFRKIFNDYLAKDLNLTNNQAPIRDDLKNLGPKGFYSAIIDRGYTYNQLVKATGLIPNIEPFKWVNFNITIAKEYLLHLIDSGALDHLNLFENQAPTMRELIDSGHNDFIQKILKTDFTYNDILKVAGLEINHEIYKYLNYKLEDFVRLFHVIMISENINNLNLNSNEAPTIKQLYDLGFGFFPSAIAHKNISYNHILKSAGYQINHENGKYSRYSIIDFINEISKIITDPNLRKILSLREKEAPTLKQLIYLGFGDVIHQMIDKKISYNEIVKRCGLTPNVYHTLQEIGRFLHWILEYIIIRHSKEKGWYAFFEVCPNILINRNKVDISIILSKSDRIFLSKNFSNNVYLLNLDFTMTSNDDFLVEKCLKGYQSQHKLLIIICLYSPTYEMKLIRERVFKKLNQKQKENLSILNTDEFFEFLNFPIKLKDFALQFIELAKKSIFDENNYKNLEYYSNYAKEKLIFGYSDRSRVNFESVIRNLNLFYILKN